MSENLDVKTLRAAFSRFPSGVTVLSGLVAGKPAGMAVSSFTPISLDPPLIAASIQRTSSTWPLLRATPSLGVSVLAQHQGELGRRLSGPGDRFAGTRWTATESGAVLIDDASAYFQGAHYQELPAGDHLIALLEVTAVELRATAQPLIFHRSGFRQLA